MRDLLVMSSSRAANWPERVFATIDTGSVSPTQQNQRDDADINTIVKRFGLNGTLPQNIRTPLNADFEDVFDYQSAMNVIIEGDRAFAAMPADVRKRFGNDPAEFMNFISDEKNVDEAVKLGLRVRRPEPLPEKPVEVRVVADPDPPTKPVK